MVALIRFAALLATLMLLGAPLDVSAYPAVQKWRVTTGGTSCPVQSGYTFSTAAEACATITSAQGWAYAFNQCNPPSGSSFTYTGMSGNSCRGSCVSGGSGCGTLTGGVASESAACPNGGSLSGSNCVCPVGKVDNGSACVDPCPADEFVPYGGTACEKRCPLDEPGGAAEFAPGSPSFCGERKFQTGFASGTTRTDTASQPVTCEYRPTGSVTVCADMGSGMSCYSEYTRATGNTCSSNMELEKPITNEPTVCDAGDLYCKTDGPCGSGFTGGQFNGEKLCIKNGEKVENVSQRNSSLVPPTPSDLVDPPTPQEAPSGEGDGEDLDPIFRTVVKVGTGTGTSDGGGGTGEDIVTCGLPDTPKCKIDETGTPTKGDFGTATGQLNDAAKAREDGLATVTSAQGKNTSWAWNLALPTGCQPLSINMLLKVVTFDPCSYQAVFHDLMSLLWAGATLFAVFGLVGRTLRES